MPGKGHSPEQVLDKLRQVEVAVAGGKSVGQAVREIGVTATTPTTGGDASTVGSTSTRQESSRSLSRKTPG